MNVTIALMKRLKESTFDTYLQLKLLSDINEYEKWIEDNNSTKADLFHPNEFIRIEAIQKYKESRNVQ